MEPGPKGPGKRCCRRDGGGECRLQWSPDQKARESTAIAAPRIAHRFCFNGARTKRPGKVDAELPASFENGLQWSPDQKARERSARSATAASAPSCFNGARTKRPGIGCEVEKNGWPSLQWSPDQKARESHDSSRALAYIAPLQWSPDQKARERTIGESTQFAPWKLQWSPDQKARESRPGVGRARPIGNGFNGARTKRPGKVGSTCATRAATGRFNGARTKRPGKGFLTASRSAVEMLQWSPDQKARERARRREVEGPVLVASMEPGPKGPGKSGTRTGNGIRPDSFNGARTKRPGKEPGSSLPRAASACFNGARTKRPGKGTRCSSTARRRPLASMEPGPKGPGKFLSAVGVDVEREELQWSPDQKARESRRLRPGEPRLPGFNGARTKRPGKGGGPVLGVGRGVGFNGARTKRPGKELAFGRAGVRVSCASMEPGPKGPGKSMGLCRFLHPGPASMEPGPKGPGKSATTRWRTASDAASMEPGPKGPGKSGSVCCAYRPALASMEPGPKGPGKSKSSPSGFLNVLLQWSPDQKARESVAHGGPLRVHLSLQWSPDQKARESGLGERIVAVVVGASMEPGPKGPGKQALSLLGLLGLARFNGARTKRPGKVLSPKRSCCAPVSLQWSPDQKARERSLPGARPRRPPRGFNGARTKRPGKVDGVVLIAEQGSASMEPGPKGPGKNSNHEADNGEKSASMEPGPKGPGKAPDRGRFSVRSQLQWSPDQKARERARRSASSGTRTGFNGARTKRPGKGSRPRGAPGSIRASMEPGPKGPGKVPGFVGHLVLDWLQWSPDQKARERLTSRTSLKKCSALQWSPDQKARESGDRGGPQGPLRRFNGARTKRPGKAGGAHLGPKASRASMEPGPKGPGKWAAPAPAGSTPALQWSPDQKARERKPIFIDGERGSSLQWSPDQKARERSKGVPVRVRAATLQWSPDQKARERICQRAHDTTASRFNGARTKRPGKVTISVQAQSIEALLQWSPDQKARENAEVARRGINEAMLQWSPDQKARERANRRRARDGRYMLQWSPDQKARESRPQ